MNSQISLEQIIEFSKTYNSNKINKLVENAITRNGLEKACMNRDIIIENQPVFNIELPESKRYNQKDSNKCWIYAGLNMIKHNIALNLNIDVKELELSNSYIAFFDKLEKANNTYENIIKLDNLDWDYINNENFLRYCVTEGGHWQWFLSIINKYGIIPEAYMLSSFEGMRFQKAQEIYMEKVKKDVVVLLNIKRQGENETKLREKKAEFLQENYILLSKIYGEPIREFDYEYKNKNNQYVIYTNMTPIDYRRRFLTLELNDFISIGNLPMYNKKYYKIYRQKYLANIYENSYVDFLNLPIEELKELVIKQLKDNIPVYMRVNLKKFRDEESGVLDKRLYNYDKTLNIDYLTKEEALNTHDIYPHHCMVFTGVNIVNNKPQRWKVEDSYGDKQKLNGCYVMNDNYFDEFVLQIIIHKKYLKQEQIILLKQEPIEFEIEEPF